MIDLREFQRELNRLKNNTGIKFELDLSSLDENYIMEQLKRLNNAYEEKYNIDYFWKKLLKGGFDDNDLKNIAKDYGIPIDEKYALLLMEIKEHEETPAKIILREFFPAHLHNYIVQINNNMLAIVFTSKEDDIDDVAMAVKGVLNTDAMIPVNISYSKKKLNIDELPQLYKTAVKTLEVGRIFGDKDDIYVAEKFGLENLICALDEKASDKFLNSIHGEKELENFDSELIHTIESFWENNLNIAETSRKMHMHRNTLIYRIEQVIKKTGLDVRKFDDAVKLKIAIMIIKNKKTGGKLHE